MELKKVNDKEVIEEKMNLKKKDTETEKDSEQVSEQES